MAWLEQLLGDDPAYLEQQAADTRDEMQRRPDTLDLYAQVRTGEDQVVIVRDLVALREFRSSLLEVLAAYDLLLDTLGRAEPMDWKTFRADVELALQRRHVNVEREGSRQGRVLVTTAFEARGLHHEHVFILGLSEGIFPAQQNESPLYSDRERRDLIETYKLRIQDPAERNRDMGLFYEMCSLAKSSLLLTRPTLDPGGNPWSASIYWKTVVNLLPDAGGYRIPPGSCPSIEQAASRREAAMSLCQLLNTPDSEITEQAWAYTAWFQQDTLWANIEKGREIERCRETSHLPFDIYSGILSDSGLIDAVRQQLGSSYTWSATQFNELASCGFRFFSSRLLGLEAYKEPEEGMDAMQLGTVNHAILEETYDEIGRRGLAIREENREEALAILEQTAARIFRTAPQAYGFRATALWKHEQENLLEKLKWLIHKDFSEDSPFAALKGERHPLAQEMTFGREEPMWIELPDLGALRVRGAIDRMDIVDEQNVIIADYKSSHIPTRSDAESGRNFQMMLYLMAAQELLRRRNLQFRIAGGLFWSIRSGEDSRLIESAKLENARAQLTRHILNARQGAFPSKPTAGKGDQCVSYCDFGKFCRLHRSHRWKPVHMDASVGD